VTLTGRETSRQRALATTGITDEDPQRSNVILQCGAFHRLFLKKERTLACANLEFLTPV
jgi:hypothetical protein